ncbi:hypothetical protein HDU80_003827, partial [Chytriomyces hyalinus]
MGYAQDYTGSHSSFNLGRFRASLVERHRWKHVLSDFFQNQQHQRRKYRAQLGVRSSESKLANNILSKFKDGDRELALCWGNWNSTAGANLSARQCQLPFSQSSSGQIEKPLRSLIAM